MRTPHADNDDERNADYDERGAASRDGQRERGAALRRDETLLKPEWLMRRLPPNKMPAQQHEATGETHTTEPCLILFDTPPTPTGPLEEPTSQWVLAVAIWQKQDAMRQRKTGFGVIPGPFRGQKETISPHCSRWR
jgi:hypothetical protein